MQYYKNTEKLCWGAATSLLVNASKQCKNDQGEVVALNISRLIFENQQEWFGQDVPLLAETAMTDLIDEYIRLTRPII